MSIKAIALLIRAVVAIVLITISASNVNAYSIGGAYASLVSCDWGQYGYQWGWIGTYEANGGTYQIFFGGSYCQY